MAFFDKNRDVLARLQNHEYKNSDEKIALLNELKQEHPSPQNVLWMLSHSDARFRDFALHVVSQDRSRNTFQLLVKEMKRDPGTQKYICPILGKISPEGLIPYLSKEMSSADISRRRQAMDIAIHFSGIQKILPILKEAINDPNEDIRFKAAHKLSQNIRERQMFTYLAPFMDDSSSKVRHTIIREAATTSFPQLIQHFFARLPHEPRNIQDCMINALGRLAHKRGDEISEKIIPELASEHEFSREVAVRLLGELPRQKEIVIQFLQYTRGIAFWLRDRIFQSISTISSKITPVVIEILEDKDNALRLDCMYLALHIRDQRLIPGIARIVQSSDLDWWAKDAAIDILVKLRAPRLFELLKPYEEDPDIKVSVINAYGRLSHNGAFEYLCQNLHDSSRYVQMQSLSAISKLSIPESKAVIRKVAETCPDWVVRNEAGKIAEEKGISFRSGVYSKPEINKDLVLQELKSLGLEMEDDSYVENTGKRKVHVHPTQKTARLETMRRPANPFSSEKVMDFSTQQAAKRRATAGIPRVTTRREARVDQDRLHPQKQTSSYTPKEPTPLTEQDRISTTKYEHPYSKEKKIITEQDSTSTNKHDKAPDSNYSDFSQSEVYDEMNELSGEKSLRSSLVDDEKLATKPPTTQGYYHPTQKRSSEHKKQAYGPAQAPQGHNSAQAPQDHSPEHQKPVYDFTPAPQGHTPAQAPQDHSPEHQKLVYDFTPAPQGHTPVQAPQEHSPDRQKQAYDFTPAPQAYGPAQASQETPSEKPIDLVTGPETPYPSPVPEFLQQKMLMKKKDLAGLKQLHIDKNPQVEDLPETNLPPKIGKPSKMPPGPSQNNLVSNRKETTSTYKTMERKPFRFDKPREGVIKPPPVRRNSDKFPLRFERDKKNGPDEQI